MTGVALLTCLICSLLKLGLATGTAGETTVRVSATPVFPAIPWGKQRDDFEVVVRVEAPAALQMHAPIDLVLVLDISDSMSAPAASLGDPSRLDFVKKAMKFVIGKLDSRDRLAIVALNDHVVKEYSTELLHISGDGGYHARRKVDELIAGGRTAFEPALERAVQILDERPIEEDRLGFILLLSDGIEDSGIKWCKESTKRTILLGKYPVHSFGISTSHDPKALQFIAQASQGTYSFINDNLVDSITSALAVCLGGLKTIVAAHTHVKLSAAEQGGVEIKSIESGGYRKHVSSDRSWGEIVLDVLYAGEVKNFIVRLHVPAVSSTCVIDHHRQVLLTVAAEGSLYSHATGVQAEDAVVLHIQRPKVVADAGRQDPSPTVVSRIVQFELVELMSKFLHKELDVITTADLGSQIERKWVKFSERHKFWSGVDLGVLDTDISAMVSSLRSGAGVGYIYSWVSSYLMQRATTMGSADMVVPEFFTSSMRFMLKEAREFQEPVDRHPSVEAQDYTFSSANMEMIDRRLELWHKLKREVPTLFQQPSEDAEWNHLTAITQEASIEAINRAMHHEMYLAIVHTSNTRRCYSKRGGLELGTGPAC
ncbi:hypothetical protein PR202_gb25836 [Eleusine coracana subsp. coracana]|uniref:VWFA domain-containing protein n=1 Tax=Eleusine coracana subsp. coracana TaxID=191504 RepID=A0AAV5FPP2_ELECO|nr:hypothetical protein QOZ80_4BG0354000 [Eleusine coracana subsp. coracana]GJN36899.1 hypothetical protein PR202_gb25800 [Eleusine coracana subsp. coracana]GJN36932.1 hypothetical protein PR202_gb25836 [Eleusine coracana subsp. coracana]